MSNTAPLRRPIMITLAMAWFLSYADRVNMSVASIPMQAEFGWDETTKGLEGGEEDPMARYTYSPTFSVDSKQTDII